MKIAFRGNNGNEVPFLETVVHEEVANRLCENTEKENTVWEASQVSSCSVHRDSPKENWLFAFSLVTWMSCRA